MEEAGEEPWADMKQKLRCAIRAGAAPAIVAFGLSSCLWPFGPDYEDRISDVLSVAMPDTVRAGASFLVTIITSSGGPGCWGKGPDEVRAGPAWAMITPYDRTYTGSGGCLDNPPITHKVVLKFVRPGIAGVAIRHGKVVGPDSTGMIVRRVVVQ